MVDCSASRRARFGRSRAYIVAAAVVLAALAVASLLVPRRDRQTLDWTLLGTRDGGRTLVVGFAANYRPCISDLRAHAIEGSFDRVDVSVDADVGDCEQQSSQIIDPVTIRLSRPVEGRVVNGAGRTIREVEPLHRRRWRLDTPDLSGLSLGDAQAVGVAYGLTVRATHASDRSVWRSAIKSQRRLGDSVVVTQ